MTLDKGLFLEICRKYGVQFSDAYDTLMLNENGHIRELREEDIERIMLPSEVMFCNDSGAELEINIPQETLSVKDYSLSETQQLAA